MAKIAEIHRRLGLGYELPATFGPLFPILKLATDENGQIVGAVAVKVVSEAFFWTNPEISDYKRAKSLKLLSWNCSSAAKRLGLEEVSAWLPPKVVKCFARIIEKLGWRPSPWKNWSLVLK